ncbi:hypothetical protein GJ496_001265 [Pomphorhynchus laevis]|nr:hypothetical protein GJ496_001265 [Pomphorhynchus laevis]
MGTNENTNDIITRSIDNKTSTLLKYGQISSKFDNLHTANARGLKSDKHSLIKFPINMHEQKTKNLHELTSLNNNRQSSRDLKVSKKDIFVKQNYWLERTKPWCNVSPIKLDNWSKLKQDVLSTIEEEDSNISRLSQIECQEYTVSNPNITNENIDITKKSDVIVDNDITPDTNRDNDITPDTNRDNDISSDTNRDNDITVDTKTAKQGDDDTALGHISGNIAIINKSYAVTTNNVINDVATNKNDVIKVVDDTMKIDNSGIDEVNSSDEDSSIKIEQNNAIVGHERFKNESDHEIDSLLHSTTESDKDEEIIEEFRKAKQRWLRRLTCAPAVDPKRSKTVTENILKINMHCIEIANEQSAKIKRVQKFPDRGKSSVSINLDKTSKTKLRNPSSHKRISSTLNERLNQLATPSKRRTVDRHERTSNCCNQRSRINSIASRSSYRQSHRSTSCNLESFMANRSRMTNHSTIRTCSISRIGEPGSSSKRSLSFFERMELQTKEAFKRNSQIKEIIRTKPLEELPPWR